MRSIGRTLKTSSVLLALGAFTSLTTGVSLYLRAQDSWTRLQRNGDIEVNWAALAKISSIQLGLDQRGPEPAAHDPSHAGILHGESLDSPVFPRKIRKVRWNRPRLEPTQIQVAKEGLDPLPRDEISLTSAVALRPEFLASDSELLKFQEIHAQTQRQFVLAIRELERLSQPTTQIASRSQLIQPDPEETMSDEEYAALAEAYLEQVDAASAVVVEDVIDASQAAPRPQSLASDPGSPQSESDTGIGSGKSLQQREVASIEQLPENESEAVEFRLPEPEPRKLTTQTPIEGSTPAVESPPKFEATRSPVIAELPEPIREEPLQIPPTVEESVPTQPVAQASPVQPPAARLVTEETPLSTQMNTQNRKLLYSDRSEDEPSLDENDYAFLQEENPGVLQSRASSTPSVEHQKASARPDLARLKNTQKVEPPKKTERMVLAQNAPAQTKTKAASVTGVSQDSQGITIQWNMSSSARALEPSPSASVKPSEKIPDPRKFCDSALIGTLALSNTLSEPMSVCRRPLSLEGSVDGKQARWWEVRESVDHWPTLIFQKEKDAFDPALRVPMLPIHAAKALSILNKAKIQENAGIVLGELQPDQEVSLKGRSDPIMYFDMNYQFLESRENARYFGWMNVGPGNPLIVVRSQKTNRVGSLPIVVRPGHVTYIRIPQGEAKSLSLRILDSASLRKPKPVSGLSVTVIGQSGRSGVTNSRGEVAFKDVITFGEYAFFVDVAPNEKSFKHRYRFTRDVMKNRDLFYFKESTITSWTSQLQGGISSLSGMVVGAFLKLPSQAPNVFVRMQTVEARSPLNPEVYVLGGEDHLISHPKLDGQYRRFIGVQIPEGTQIPTALGSDGSILWSEVIVAQPGVINVVSP